MARDETKRDKSRDVWLMRFGLDQALESKEPRTVRLLPESNQEYERIGYTLYVPHDQLEAECERHVATIRGAKKLAEDHAARVRVLVEASKRVEATEERLRVCEFQLATAKIVNEAAEKRIAELEQQLTNTTSEPYCWHCLDVLVRDEPPHHCENCPPPGMCDGCDAPGHAKHPEPRLAEALSPELQAQEAEDRVRKVGRDW